MTDKTLARIADALEKLVDAYKQAQRRDHYALTDRYAANEARQREEAAGPDPLDEDDHSTRLLADGTPLTRRASGHWHTPDYDCQQLCPANSSGFALGVWNQDHGPLTFAPDASPAPQDAAQGAAESKADAVEGAGAAGPPEALLCHECGHDIEDHGLADCCECLSLTGVAYALIADAVKAERERAAQEPDPEPVVLPEGWRLDNGHDLIQPGDYEGARVGVVARDHRKWYAMSATSDGWRVCDTKQRAVDFLHAEAERESRR